jgi:uncharacterized spore protein YtfJ
MGESMNLFSVVKTQTEASELIGKLIDTARPSGVFSEPIATEGCTVITASEVSVGMGIGYGIGGNVNSDATAETEAPPENEEQDDPLTSSGDEIGGGGGGGGGASARPVAIIKITADGVTVEPIVDVTKIALAMFTTVASMFVMMSKIWGKK